MVQNARIEPELRRLKRMELAALILNWVLGVLFHFVYEWTGENPLVGLFAPVNESVWEHIKLLFFPALLVMAVEYFLFGHQIPNYLTAKTIGIVLGGLSIPLLFYAYTAVLGKHIAAIDIAIFFVAVLLGELICYWLLRKSLLANARGRLESGLLSERYQLLALTVLLLLVGVFFYFTEAPPELPLFLPPTG